MRSKPLLRVLPGLVPSALRAQVKTNLYEYPLAPNEPFPTLEYTIHLERATFFYLNFTLLPSVILSLISFSVFFMSFAVGERLGFGITLVLVVEVSKQTIASLLPICGELLWMELFFWINFLACVLALLERCPVLAHLTARRARNHLHPCVNPLRSSPPIRAPCAAVSCSHSHTAGRNS